MSLRRSDLLIFCVIALRFASVQSIEIMGEEGHPVDHKHDFDHNEPQHGHAKDHKGHNDPHNQQDKTLAEHEKEHHEDFLITQKAYDVRDRPDSAKNIPCTVYLEIDSHYIPDVDEETQEVTAAITLTVSWRDDRVLPLKEVVGLVKTGQNYSGGISFPGHIKETIWMPDLYLPMARRVSIPTITEPAESLTLLDNHQLKYSAFFIFAFKCQMTYSNYPMDEQHCFVDLMSYSLDMKKLMLKWGNNSLRGNTRIATRHFDITIYKPAESTYKTFDLRQALRIKFHLRRWIEYHLLQTYLPTGMLVLIGWISLFVPLDFAYGRMVLNITTLLVLVSIYVSTSQHSPGVNEVKALDVWLFMCICFVFTAILNCIVDLRLLSIVEKESQIAAEDLATRARIKRHLVKVVPESALGDILHPRTRGRAKTARLSWLINLGIISQPTTTGPRVLPPLFGANRLPPLEPIGRQRPGSSTSTESRPPSAPVAAPAFEEPPPPTDLDPAELYGDNVPFQRDRQPLVATPVVLWWLRLALNLERVMMVLYPLLYVVLVAVYWGVYIARWTSQ